MSTDEAQVRDVVRAVLNRTLGLAAAAPRRPAITSQTIAAAAPGAEVRAAPDQVITPLARDAARERGVTLVEARADEARRPDRAAPTNANDRLIQRMRLCMKVKVFRASAMPIDPPSPKTVPMLPRRERMSNPRAHSRRAYLS